ncbi:MAG: T9SS type A sorting domain-containing protein [Ignavibacteriaceae bacterium]|nr:T9SS type A sorting domain-containing protein [Ignavibacteriaceae bacterium]
MKKILILFITITSYIFSQGWNNTVTTTINEPNLVMMDVFSNKDGNHVIVQNSNSTNSINYYLLNSSGEYIRSTTIETSGNAEFPSITGDKDKVYLAYKLSSNLKISYSTNAGQNWTNLNPKAIGSNACNGVDIVYGENGVHVVYAMLDNLTYYETYYYFLNSSHAWVDYKNVTDYNNFVDGGKPTVAISSNRVHVSWSTSDNNYYPGAVLSRDRYYSTWQTPQIAVEGDWGADNSINERLVVSGTKLNLIYVKYLNSGGLIGNYLAYKTRDLSGTSWSSSSAISNNLSGEYACNLAVSNNGNINLAFEDDGIQHTYFNGSSWSSFYTLDENTEPYHPIGISTTGNDVYVLWKNLSDNYSRFQRYDANPITPTNFAGTTYNNQPKITWGSVNEPDVYNYIDGIKVYRGYKDESEIEYYMLADEIPGNSTSWIDTEVTLVNPRQPHTTYLYKVSAVDIGLKESAKTTAVQYSGTGPLWKISGGENSEELTINEFKLSQNYPNPFNPSTAIRYQLAANGFVTLKVYDVLGSEVAVLANEWQEAGNYSFQFTTSGKQLASGMYVYRLQATNGVREIYSATKRMLLVK